jgi:hypothetical protein
MKRMIFLFILVSSVFPVSCGAADTTREPLGAVTETVIVATSTPDLCSSANLPSEVDKVHKLMREFDDYSSLASHVPQVQLINLIPEMQRILRDTEDLQVPPCLKKLKEYEIAHMQLVVQVLIAFLNITNADAQAINTAIEAAQQMHAKYDIERARLLGGTLVVPVNKTPGTGTGTVTPTVTATLTP